ncbi:MAG: twin-arginine translocase TatA/TatE family subunit [Leucobacter sp.]
MLGNLSGWHLIAILFVILLMFGAPKLPGLAKSLGQSMRILKKEVSGDAETPEAGKADPDQPGSGKADNASSAEGASESKRLDVP